MDLTPFTDAVADVTPAIATVGGAIVAAYVATKTFGFVTAWVGRLFAAGKGRSSG